MKKIILLFILGLPVPYVIIFSALILVQLLRDINMITGDLSNYFFEVFKSKIPIYFVPFYWGLNSVIFINLSEK